MITRFIRTQLIIFTIASIIGLATMAITYLQVPVLLGWGRITVTLDLPAGGGLYERSNVTYRGLSIGKVTAVTLTPTGAKATLSLDTSPRVPAELTAEVRSISAVGEQYVDLRPANDSPPYLEDGDVIPATLTRLPQPVGPMLDSVNSMLNSVPKDNLSTMIDESFVAFDGAGYDIGSLLDSGAVIAGEANKVAPRTRQLIEDISPLLDGQRRSANSLQDWSQNLAGVTEQLADNDPQIRTLLDATPGALDEVSRLLSEAKPTLPVLLANLISVGKVAVTYNPSLEQLLVLLPPLTAYYQSSRATNNPTGIPQGDFRVQISDPPSCTVGFLPPSQWRSPADTTTIDTPDDLYCKLPQDSPIAVKGARNLPCMGHPGKRAPTVEICDSDRPYLPLAMRQHILGPGPIDPNLISEGIPVDDRVPGEAPIYGPIEGTPPPLETTPSNLPGSPAILPPHAQPSSHTQGPGQSVPVVTAEYDPRTGSYLTPDGLSAQQVDLAWTETPRWQDLILPPSI